MNFWIPITPVAGVNSLWVESEPEKEDFHPLEGGYGDIFQFYGNQCKVPTMPCISCLSGWLLPSLVFLLSLSPLLMLTAPAAALY